MGYMNTNSDYSSKASPKDAHVTTYGAIANYFIEWEEARMQCQTTINWESCFCVPLKWGIEMGEKQNVKCFLQILNSSQAGEWQWWIVEYIY